MSSSPFHDRWERTLRDARCPAFSSRAELYAYLNRSFLDDGGAPLDFFEFGVYRGESLRAWCELIKNPKARFFGFDSFEGLPEYWKPSRPKGSFNTFGRTPEIDDPRVRFITGWFQQSLPEFLKSYQPANRLVIHNDCDLYSSTLFCLTCMNCLMSPGTLVTFDEFDDVLHEHRALTDYADAYMRKYEIVAATREFTQATVVLL